jgi:F420-dependent oxidoreductase-like protein
MRIGIGVGGAVGLAAGLEGHLREIEAAERDGFHSVWIPHIRGWDALTVIALAGPRTGRIEMMTGVVPVYTRHPVLMAQQALTTQAATAVAARAGAAGRRGDRAPRGRLTLGIGLAHPETVSTWWGLSYDRPARYMREYLAILLPLLRGESVTFAGQVHRASASLDLTGLPAPAVLLAALAPRMLDLAGAVADGTLTWMVGRRALETHVLPRIRRAAQRAGRPAPRVCVALPVCVTDDAAAARRVIGERFKRYGQLENYRRVLDIGGAAGPADVAIVGTEADVEAQIRALAAAGATDFLAAVTPAGPDPAASGARTRTLMKALASAHPQGRARSSRDEPLG